MAYALLDLPLEIQVLVYQFYFHGPHSAIQLSWRDWRKPMVVNVADSKCHFALLRTCKSIYRTAIPYIDQARLTIDARSFVFPYIIPDYSKDRPNLARLFRCTTKLLIPDSNVYWSFQLPRLEHVEIFCSIESQTLNTLEHAVDCYFKKDDALFQDRKLVASIISNLPNGRGGSLNFTVPDSVDLALVIPFVMAKSLVDKRYGTVWITTLFELHVPDGRPSKGRVAAKRIDEWPREHDENELTKELLQVLRNMVWYRTEDPKSTASNLQEIAESIYLRDLDLPEFTGQWIIEEQFLETCKAIEERRAQRSPPQSPSNELPLRPSPLSANVHHNLDVDMERTLTYFDFDSGPSGERIFNS